MDDYKIKAFENKIKDAAKELAECYPFEKMEIKINTHKGLKHMQIRTSFYKDILHKNI